jgi:Fe-S cluster assembly iron-binding protein IscA
LSGFYGLLYGDPEVAPLGRSRFGSIRVIINSPRLEMVLDEPREGDETVQLKGIDLVYDLRDMDLLNRTIIDYQDSWIGERFVICSPTSEPC